MSIKVILDTDIGSDVDDAVCLAYLLAQPDCELLGITTVSGEVYKRAMLASVLCKAADKKIPIFPGCEEPLFVAQKQKYAPQAEVLQKWEHDKDFPKEEAIEFMRQTIYKHPGEIVLLTIGPLTNIAMLFKKDSKIPSLLKGLVMMCGVFTTHQPSAPAIEWNITCDPHAADIVYNSDVSVHRSIGLDVTIEVVMGIKQFKERFHSGLLKPVSDFAEVWFRQTDKTTFPDPLAAATIFDEKICVFKKGIVEVELSDEKLRGTTRWTPDVPDKRHEVALEVDSSRFFEHYFSVFSKLT